MRGTQERIEEVVETPQRYERQARKMRLLVLMVAIAAIAAIGIGWLVVSDSENETTPVEGSGALVDTSSGFPFGSLEDRDSGTRRTVWNEDGTYMFSSGSIVVRGTYEIDGDLLTVLTDSRDPQGGSGTYNWTYEDDVLEFSVIEDGNRNRYAFITYPWTHIE